MATFKASEIGIAKLRHCQELSGKSWDDVAAESRVVRSLIFKLLGGKGVTKEVINDLAKYSGSQAYEGHFKFSTSF